MRPHFSVFRSFLSNLAFPALLILAAIPGIAQLVPNEYALYLADPPVSQRFHSRELTRGPEAVAYRRQIELRHAAVKQELRSRKIAITGEVSTLLNAIFVAARPDRFAELQAIPGVVAVRPMLRGKRLLNSATQLMNAPAAWFKLGGIANAGAGMKVAILDTGIDQNHPAFQDSSLPMPAGYPICTDGHPEDCAYTNNKVIVARSYVRQIGAGSGPENSSPDDFSPRDRVGHGTAVASVVAANQNTGPAAGFNGMAPKAYLGNYKIYGSQGVNDYSLVSSWIQAIEDAFNDGMDVANLSSGAPAVSGALDSGAICGNPAGIPCDPIAAAFEQAASLGLIITVSAGNSGSDSLFYSGGDLPYPTYNSISSPATAPSVVTVGATTNSHVLQPAVTVKGADAPTSLVGIAAAEGDSYSYGFPGFLGSAEAPLIDVTQLGDDGFACSSLPAYSLQNSFALIEANPLGKPCDQFTQSYNASNAGAIGIVFYMSTAGAPANPENIFTNGPTVMISNDAGGALKSFIGANPGRTVIIDRAGRQQSISDFSKTYNFTPPLREDQIASYSSSGPTPDGLLKPDLVATGGFDPDQIPDFADPYLPAPTGLYVAAQSYDPAGVLFSGNGYAGADGTSFAAPMAAGAAAMAKQAHPGFSAAQVKSLLVNSTTSQIITDDGNPLTGAQTAADARRLGSGLLDAGAAAGETLTAEPAVVSFSFLKSAMLPIAKSLTITNHGATAVVLTATVTENNPAAGTTVTATSPGSLAPGASGILMVTLSGSVPGPGAYSGFVTLQGGGVSMRIPYLYMVGDGVPASGQVFTGGSAGAPGQDLGPMLIQIVDKYGVPVSGSPVAFNVNPPRGVILQSIAGAPVCTPSTSSTSVTCNTDSYGDAWVDVVMGSAGAGNNNTVVVSASVAASQLGSQFALLPAPAITAAGVVDAEASLSPIAPGSYIAIYGSNLADPNNVLSSGGDVAKPLPGGALPLMLDGTTVTFDVPSAGISVPGYMYYTSTGQLDVWVPRELQGQSSVQVKVIVDEAVPGNVVTVPLADYAPAFIANAGILSARDSTPQENIITTSNPAPRGQPVLLFANGLGPVTNPPASGDPALGSPLSRTTTDPIVMIGNAAAHVDFSGLAPGFAGLYQINVDVPMNIGTGPQPVTLTIGGKTTPVGMLYVQ